MEIFIERNNTSINDKKGFNNGNLLILCLVLLGFIIIFSYGIDNVSAAGDTIYVNASGGHDSSSGSSWLIAKKSILNATRTVNTGGTVNIANGMYTGVKTPISTLTRTLPLKAKAKLAQLLMEIRIDYSIFNRD